MALTYAALATTTVGSGGASTILFSSIPQIYTDLVVQASLRTNANDGNNGWQNISVSLNSAGSNFTRRFLLGQNGNTLATSSASDNFFLWVNSNLSTANSFGSAQIYISNYTASTAKSLSFEAITENNSANALTSMSAGLWNDTSAITSITLNSLGTFPQYCSATLYGIKNTV